MPFLDVLIDVFHSLDKVCDSLECLKLVYLVDLDPFVLGPMSRRFALDAYLTREKGLRTSASVDLRLRLNDTLRHREAGLFTIRRLGVVRIDVASKSEPPTLNFTASQLDQMYGMLHSID